MTIKKKLKFEKPFLIAEIGINHNGSLKLLKLSDLKETGFNAVKFQKRNQILLLQNLKRLKLDQTLGRSTYLDYKWKIEFGKKNLMRLIIIAKKKIIWFASAWDLKLKLF